MCAPFQGRYQHFHHQYERRCSPPPSIRLWRSRRRTGRTRWVISFPFARTAIQTPSHVVHSSILELIEVIFEYHYTRRAFGIERGDNHKQQSRHEKNPHENATAKATCTWHSTTIFGVLHLFRSLASFSQNMYKPRTFMKPSFPSGSIQYVLWLWVSMQFPKIIIPKHYSRRRSRTQNIYKIMVHFQ